MRKSKYTEEQIAMALRQAKAGTPVADICRKLQVIETRWHGADGGGWTTRISSRWCGPAFSSPTESSSIGRTPNSGRLPPDRAPIHNF
jgi:putative transposase